MKAIRVHNFGGTENLSLDEIEKPSPRADEILVKTAVAGINFADTMLRNGTYFFRPPLPFVPGFEVAGTIEEVGSDVQNVQVGQRVLAKMTGGGYAEFAVTKANQVVAIPNELDFSRATALFVQGLTALGLLKILQPGQTILIHAAAGGVGQLLVQLAKLKGAKVIGTASSAEKLEKVTGLGADYGINYTEPNWSEQVLEASDGIGADLIIEMVGGEVGSQNLKCLAQGGTMIIYGAASAQDFQISALGLMAKDQTVKGYTLYSETQETLANFTGELMEHIINGRLEIMVQEFPLAQAAEAHRAIEGRKTMGKVVLTV
jgi:NADPH:quinone reductase